jgi:hypothetical protein
VPSNNSPATEDQDSATLGEILSAASLGKSSENSETKLSPTYEPYLPKK